MTPDSCIRFGNTSRQEAAQRRNVEAGVLVRDRAFARALQGQFDALVEHGLVRRLPGS